MDNKTIIEHLNLIEEKLEYLKGKNSLNSRNRLVEFLSKDIELLIRRLKK